MPDKPDKTKPGSVTPSTGVNMAECSWNNCTEEAVTNVSLDYGDEVCQACGNAKTNKMVFEMCEAHQDEFTAGNSENTILVINATGALV